MNGMLEYFRVSFSGFSSRHSSILSRYMVLCYGFRAHWRFSAMLSHLFYGHPVTRAPAHVCCAQNCKQFLPAIAGRSWNHMAFAGEFTPTQRAIFHTKMSLVLWRQFQKQFVAGHIQREHKHYSWTHTHTQTHTFDTQSIPNIISFGDVGSQISAPAHCAHLAVRAFKLISPSEDSF